MALQSQSLEHSGAVGDPVGLLVGTIVGLLLGCSVGDSVGRPVGLLVGCSVGSPVGAFVMLTLQSKHSGNMLDLLQSNALLKSDSAVIKTEAL